jgi:hypothetical protein
MDVTTLHAIAVPTATAGSSGTAFMVFYKAALRRVDWDLIPPSAILRVRWWSRHASLALWASLILAALGLAAFAAT